ncbi:phosphonate ABC transporter, permease protein PhnE [Paenibacillus alkalitolerans]|uniref:phosphonate ABC transporter, permease protein PhnE n=1 Tax=Paenibacillus alkalitolerans TaxID=2799335 RepID=UPI0018F620A6|nr:phosphonate ABC transporter, permease protein PhnE [Paenibacillus alkalitolerans]
MLWFTKRNLIFLSIVAAAAAVSWTGIGIDLAKLARAANFVDFVRNDWLPPDWSVLRQALTESAATLEIAFLSTAIALCIAMPVCFLAAANISPRSVTGPVRAFLSFLRAIPEVVLGLLFLVVVGPGPFAAVLAILVHNVGVLGKLLAELAEAADPIPQEALKASGASRSAVALYAVLPQILPNVVSQYFYRFEAAIRTSLILGVIGAGGVGQLLFIHFKIFKYNQVTVDVLVIMVLVIAADAASAWIRRRII